MRAVITVDLEGKNTIDANISVRKAGQYLVLHEEALSERTEANDLVLRTRFPLLMPGCEVRLEPGDGRPGSVVWEGDVEDDDFVTVRARIVRSGERELLVYTDDDGWVASDDVVASRAYEACILDSLPRGT